MAKRKAVKKKPAPRRSDVERLRSLVNSSIQGDREYSRKALAKKLGISTRTLSRVANNPDHQLSEKTQKRIHKKLVKEDKARRDDLHRTFKLPYTRIMQLPKIHMYKDDGGRSITFDTHGWSAAEVASF